MIGCSAYVRKEKKVWTYLHYAVDNSHCSVCLIVVFSWLYVMLF